MYYIIAFLLQKLREVISYPDNCCFFIALMKIGKFLLGVCMVNQNLGFIVPLCESKILR